MDWTHVCDEMTTEDSNISLLRNLQAELSVVTSSAQEWTWFPDFTQEIVGLEQRFTRQKECSYETSNVKPTSPSSTGRS